MIGKQDILDRATEWRLRPDMVEKDYVLGWLLAALASYPETRDFWVFKGGTCIKKCYFETYRFSEDLDFSLLPEAPYTEEEIRNALQAAARIASDQSGIIFPQDLIGVRQRQDRQRRTTFEARVAYSGPLAIHSFPRVLCDLTQHEPVLDTPSRRPIFHPYPDSLPEGVSTLAYSLDELLAEKTRALCERTRPRDLYDVVYLLENTPEIFDFPHIRELFKQKCAMKNFMAPSAAELLRIVHSADELRSEWENMLGHQLPTLPVLDDLLARLPALSKTKKVL